VALPGQVNGAPVRAFAFQSQLVCCRCYCACRLPAIPLQLHQVLDMAVTGPVLEAASPGPHNPRGGNDKEYNAVTKIAMPYNVTCVSHTPQRVLEEQSATHRPEALLTSTHLKLTIVMAAACRPMHCTYVQHTRALSPGAMTKAVTSGTPH
jgi:hypothetical protein